MELEETGQAKVLTGLRGSPVVKVIMTIKAPKGICQIYETPSVHIYNRHLGSSPTDVQCEAIKAFMEQHRG